MQFVTKFFKSNAEEANPSNIFKNNFSSLKDAALEHGYELFEKKINYHYVPTIYGKSSHKLNDIRENKDFFPLANLVFAQGRTYLYYDRLYTLYQAFQNILNSCNEKTPILLMEVGVYRGGGSYYLASLAQEYAPGRTRLFSVDTFEGHSELDLPEGYEGPHEPKQFNQTSYEEVCDYLSAFDFVSVIKNRIQDATKQIPNTGFQLIHLDVDIYQPTYFSLCHFHEKLAFNGIFIIDDYNFKTCPGAKKAVDQFCLEQKGKYAKLELQTGQCCLIRQN